nr:MAG TPA: NinG recombination protein [Caudoviricetes sp.]
MSRAREILDRVFSIYIRRRDCRDGTGRCISCGRPITFTTCDAGHYIPRTHTATRWNELNCHSQCIICNRLKHGNLAAYRAALVQKYGLPAVEELERSKHSVFKMSRSEMSDKINYYKRLIRNV